MLHDARVEAYAADLHALLDAGALDGSEPVDSGYGAIDSLELLVRIVLADAEHLTYLAERERVDPERLRTLGRDIERVWSLATAP